MLSYFDKELLKEEIKKENYREFALERAERLANELRDKESIDRTYRDKIAKLEADLAIEKAGRAGDAARLAAEAKSGYADHAIAINDERIKQMKEVYENYAKNVVEIVKAGAQSPLVIPTQNIVSAK